MATLDAVGVVVADMAATLEFYRMVGLDIPPGAEAESHVEAEIGNGLRIMFDTEDLIASVNPDWEPGSGNGRVTLAFMCRDALSVDRIYNQVVAAGHESVKVPFDAFWGQRYATVLDPDGNPVDLFAPAT